MNAKRKCEEKAQSKSKKTKTIEHEIHDACLENDTEKVLKLLDENKNDIDSNELFKRGTLHEAACIGNVTIVRKLLNLGAAKFLNETSETSYEMHETALHVAARKGHTEVVKELLKNNAHIDAHDENGTTPLIKAVRNYKYDVVRILLENKADVNVQNQFGESALFYAVKNRKIEIVDELLKNGASADVIAKNGRYFYEENGILEESALHIAISNNDLDIVKLLLKNGASPSHTTSHEDFNFQREGDDSEETALHHAVRCGNLEIVREILKFAKDCLDEKTVKGKTALHYAVENGKVEIVSELLKHGADINARCDEWDEPDDFFSNHDYNSTPLFLALEYGHVLVAKELLAHPNIDLNLRFGENDETVLHMAILKGYTSLVKLILENGHDIDFSIENGDGLTAFEMVLEDRNEWDSRKMARLIAKAACPQPKITDAIYPLKRLMGELNLN